MTNDLLNVTFLIMQSTKGLIKNKRNRRTRGQQCSPGVKRNIGFNSKPTNLALTNQQNVGCLGKKTESITVQRRHLKCASVKEPQSLRRFLCTHTKTLWSIKGSKNKLDKLEMECCCTRRHMSIIGIGWDEHSYQRMRRGEYTLPFSAELIKGQWRTRTIHFLMENHWCTWAYLYWFPAGTGNGFSAPGICFCACRSTFWCTLNQLSSGWRSRNIDFKEEGSMSQTLVNFGLCINIWKD